MHHEPIGSSLFADLGGTLFLYDCVEATLENREEEAPCTDAKVTFETTKFEQCHTGHSLFIVLGAQFELIESTIIDSQNDANEHSGALMVLDNVGAKIQKSKFENVRSDNFIVFTHFSLTQEHSAERQT